VIYFTLCACNKAEDLAMATLTVSLPDDVTDWIDGQIGEGGDASVDEHLSELVRRDHDRRNELRRIVDEGLASGVSTRTVDESSLERSSLRNCVAHTASEAD
jgi:antitoxin ParD1/3/4